MKAAHSLIIVFATALGGCIDNRTIDQEIADKCGLSEAEYQHAEAALDKGHDGLSIHVGRCRLTRSSKDVTDGVITG